MNYLLYTLSLMFLKLLQHSYGIELVKVILGYIAWFHAEKWYFLEVQTIYLHEHWKENLMYYYCEV